MRDFISNKITLFICWGMSAMFINYLFVNIHLCLVLKNAKFYFSDLIWINWVFFVHLYLVISLPLRLLSSFFNEFFNMYLIIINVI
jgi:hypothetical protein